MKEQEKDWSSDNQDTQDRFKEKNHRSRKDSSLFQPRFSALEEEDDEDETPSRYPNPPRRNRANLLWTVLIVALCFFLWPSFQGENTADPNAAQEVQDMTVVWISKDDIYYYHLDKDCAGLTDPMEWVRSEAEKRNYFPCPVCAAEE